MFVAPIVKPVNRIKHALPCRPIKRCAVLGNDNRFQISTTLPQGLLAEVGESVIIQPRCVRACVFDCRFLVHKPPTNGLQDKLHVKQLVGKRGRVRRGKIVGLIVVNVADISGEIKPRQTTSVEIARVIRRASASVGGNVSNSLCAMRPSCRINQIFENSVFVCSEILIV